MVINFSGPTGTFSDTATKALGESLLHLEGQPTKRVAYATIGRTNYTEFLLIGKPDTKTRTPPPPSRCIIACAPQTDRWQR